MPIGEEDVVRPALPQLHCVVCGQGSTRSDWVNIYKTSLGDIVACDGHSFDEVKEHLTRLKITIAPAPSSPPIKLNDCKVKPVIVPGAEKPKT